MECVKENRQLELNALLSALKAWSLWKRRNHTPEYLQTVEATISASDKLGWEREFAKSTDYSKSISAAIFRVFLEAATIFAAANVV